MFMVLSHKMQLVDDQCVNFYLMTNGVFWNTRFSKVEHLADLAYLHIVQVLTKSFL